MSKEAVNVSKPLQSEPVVIAVAAWDLLAKTLGFNVPFPQRVADTFFVLAKAFRGCLPTENDAFLRLLQIKSFTLGNRLLMEGNVIHVGYVYLGQAAKGNGAAKTRDATALMS